MKFFLYHIGVDGGKARFWFKNNKGGVFIVEREYRPYILVRKTDIEKVLTSQNVYDFEEVTLKIFPRGKASFYKIILEDTVEYHIFLKKLRERCIDAFSADISHKHKALAEFSETLLKPMALYNIDTEEEELFITAPLPLRQLFLSIFVRKNKITGFSYKLKDDRETISGDEEEVLNELEKLIEKHDPDLIVSNLDYREWDRLSLRLKRFSPTKGFGRRGFSLEGRIFLKSSLYYRIGLAGLEERCRFTFLPPQDATKLTYGRMVEERQTFLLLKRGFAVPPRMNSNVVVRSAWEIHVNDKGGIMFHPRPGIYENVASLDFESMFPHIIVKYGISYETVTRRYVRKSKNPFLPEVVKEPLRRRLYYKRLRDKVSGREKVWVKQRTNELKMLLVSSYGYSGNNYNRLGNPLTFEWINRISRKIMGEIYSLARRWGFRVLYGDTDSIFLTKRCAQQSEFEEFAAKVSRITGLPMKVDKTFRYIVFPQTRGEKFSSLKRYIGITFSGELVAKGVEAVRSDYPVFLRDFQKNLARTLFKELERGKHRVADTLMKEFRRVYEGLVEEKVDPSTLVVRVKLCREDYSSYIPHYVAALQLRRSGFPIVVGDTIEYIWVESRSPNPFKRVRAWRLFRGGHYDGTKYGEMAFKVLETLVGHNFSLIRRAS